MGIDAVLKIGGSLSRGSGLPVLCREVGRLGRQYGLVIVPGGGEFADQVRKAYRRYRLGETAAHWMALLAMDQYGYVLNHLIPGSILTCDLPSARSAAEKGKTAVLLPSSLIIREDPLPHSWQVTSDTIAAWVAKLASCPRLVLLKDVDGLAENSDARLIRQLTVEQLAEHEGGVDEYLSRFLAGASLETWVINGLCPGRLSELLDNNQTTGTCIKKGANLA